MQSIAKKVWIALWLITSAPVLWATNTHPTSILNVDELRLGYHKQQFAFQSFLNIQPHPDLLEAMMHGIHIYLIADIQIEKQNGYWFEPYLQKTKKTWKIKYNAIIRKWQIESDNGQLLNRATLKACFETFEGKNIWFIPAGPNLAKDVTYTMSVQFSLTASKAPNPFGFNLYSNDYWFVSSPWKKTTFQISELTSETSLTD
ncbi:MAG: DUF4390 domain-containing protein [Alcaligenaceae bacterium]|nr:DUF4390 domain-containing protein [Alcaligenaceae bacterium]